MYTRIEQKTQTLQEPGLQVCIIFFFSFYVNKNRIIRQNAILLKEDLSDSIIFNFDKKKSSSILTTVCKQTEINSSILSF